MTRFISKNNVEISYDTRSKTLKLSKNGNGLYVDDMCGGYHTTHQEKRNR